MSLPTSRPDAKLDFDSPVWGGLWERAEKLTHRLEIGFHRKCLALFSGTRYIDG